MFIFVLLGAIIGIAISIWINIGNDVSIKKTLGLLRYLVMGILSALAGMLIGLAVTATVLGVTESSVQLTVPVSEYKVITEDMVYLEGNGVAEDEEGLILYLTDKGSDYKTSASTVDYDSGIKEPVVTGKYKYTKNNWFNRLVSNRAFAEDYLPGNASDNYKLNNISDIRIVLPK